MAFDGKAERETGQMFEAVGRAITRWSFVEHELCIIFTVCTSDVAVGPHGGLDLGNASVPTAVFYSNENFRGKLGLVNAALLALTNELDPSSELRFNWFRLKEKTRKLSLRRNRLAHHTVIPAIYDEETSIPARLFPAYGSPGYWNATGSRPRTDLPTLNHMRHLEIAFCILEDKLREYARQLASHEELFGIYARRLARRIQSHSCTSQIRAEQLKLALSSLE